MIIKTVYEWDCITISEQCVNCNYHHNPSKGVEPHKCPYGLKQRLRRIG